MDENDSVGPTAVGPTKKAELALPRLLPVMKIPMQSCFQYDKDNISLITNWDAAYLDLLRISVGCRVVCLDGIMPICVFSEHELKTHSIVVNMQYCESTWSSNISGYEAVGSARIHDSLELQMPEER